MEMPERSGWMQRPELDYDRPARLFRYAKDKQRWLRTRVSEQQLPDAIDHLADELERFVTQTFDSMPELAITSTDVHYTRGISGRGSTHLIESGPLPFEGDAALLGEHALRATLFGFHQGDATDLRVYASQNDGIRQFMGGVYTPLLSVGVENSEIRLSEFGNAEQLEERSNYVQEQLATLDSDAHVLVNDILRTLHDPQAGLAKKLHDISQSAAALARSSETSQQFVDAVLDIIFLTLNLNLPHDIYTSSHREVITERPVPAYKAQRGPTRFTNIVPQLGFIGETANRGLGVFFIKNEKAVQIPVQYITNIQRSQR